MPTFSGFPRTTATFLKGLSENNEKAWFDAHRGEYQSAYVEPALGFVAAIGPRLQKISPSTNYEPRINGSLFRINRDVRFAKDKRPYKDHIDLWFWHGDKRGWDSPGFFFRMLSDRLILGAGMHRFREGAARKVSKCGARSACRKGACQNGPRGPRGRSV